MLTMYNSIKKKSIIVRASNFYGLDQLDHRLIPKLIKFIKNKKKFLYMEMVTQQEILFLKMILTMDCLN